MDMSQTNIEWSDRAALGIPELDVEHRELVCPFIPLGLTADISSDAVHGR